MSASNYITAIVHVAPWDWDLVSWSIPSWGLVADEILLVYEAQGRCWSCPRQHPQSPLSPGPWAEVGAPIRMLSYELPTFAANDYAQHFDYVEARVRNMASWCTPRGSVILTPDADERIDQDTAERLRIYLRRIDVNQAAQYRVGIVDVVAVRGEQALVVETDTPQRQTIAITVPGSYSSSRKTRLKPIDTAFEVLHWRARTSEDPASKAHHDRYLGEGFSQFKATVQQDTKIPYGTWKTDARGWRAFRAVPLASLGPLPQLEA